jgi:NAD(P)-dependent dehydrogenase (short-subunit alcohol dehydrogenase family)
MGRREWGHVMGELNGKVAIVTGAGGNIGSVTSRVLAEAGASVTMVDIAEERLKEVAAQLESEGLHVLAVAADVASESDVRDVVAKTVSAFGGLDILDNNAGGTALTSQHDGTVVTMDVALWDEMYGINVKGPMLFCKHSIPAMVERGGGSIINISSGTSLAGNDTYTAYASSKGALNTLTKYVATAHGAQGIRCNALALGIVVPPSMANASPPPGAPNMNPYLAHHIVGRLGAPQDIANMVLFLSTEKSGFITGQIISIDGGFFAHLPTFPAAS